MEQERLNLYYMDIKYIRDLHNADERVQSVSPQIQKIILLRLIIKNYVSKKLFGVVKIKKQS